MQRLFQAILLAGLMAWSFPLGAQQVHSCSNYSLIVDSPEDQLMTAVNGANDPSAKVVLLEKFLQEHSNSKYAPCAEQLLTRNHVNLQQYKQAIAAGQKAVAAGYLDVSFLEDLLHAYMGSGNAGNEAFDLIMKAPAQIKAEANIPRQTTQSNAQYEAAKKNALKRAGDDTAYMTYAFFQLLHRVTDPARQIKLLDEFTQAYPEAAKKRAGTLNYRYAVAYTQSNQVVKADEYAEKAIAAAPDNVEALNLIAYDYALRRRVQPAKATAYAQKVLGLIPNMKKQQGVSDEAFKSRQNTQEGMARLTLGFLQLQKYGASHKTAGAINQLKQAAALLKAIPELQGEAYYFLGYSYEAFYPPQHREAIAALQHAVEIKSSMQDQARNLLARIKRVAH